MDWPDEPASEQQVMHLRNLGVAATQHLTMTAAARLIRQYQRNLRHAIPASSSHPIAGPASALHCEAKMEGGVSESARNMAQRLHEASANAKHAIAVSPQAPNARADFATASVTRLEFWLDTCRDLREMQVASVQVYELHHDYGHRLFAPTREQTQEILDALDAAMPLWDKEHPELFYETLELNFPNLVRKPRLDF